MKAQHGRYLDTIYLTKKGDGYKTRVGCQAETDALTTALFESARPLAMDADTADFLLDLHEDDGTIVDTIALSADAFTQITGEPVLTEDEYQKIDTDFWSAAQAHSDKEAEKRKHCSRWRKFIDEATGGDTRAINTLRGFIALCLDPQKRADHALLLAGPGKGKTTVARVVADLMPDGEVSYMPISGFEFPELLDRFDGKRINLCSLGFKYELDLPTFKAIVTGEPITAQSVEKGEFTFSPHCKLILGTNDADIENPLCRRVLFEHQPPEPDPDLYSNLLQELEGIRAWAMVPENMTTICEYCDDEIELEESRTCETCGIVLCPECVCPECDG